MVGLFWSAFAGRLLTYNPLKAILNIQDSYLYLSYGTDCYICYKILGECRVPIWEYGPEFGQTVLCIEDHLVLILNEDDDEIKSLTIMDVLTKESKPFKPKYKETLLHRRIRCLIGQEDLLLKYDLSKSVLMNKNVCLTMRSNDKRKDLFDCVTGEGVPRTRCNQINPDMSMIAYNEFLDQDTVIENFIEQSTPISHRIICIEDKIQNLKRGNEPCCPVGQRGCHRRISEITVEEPFFTMGMEGVLQLIGEEQDDEMVFRL